MNVFITGGDKGIGRAIIEVLSPISDNIFFTYNSNKNGADEICNLYTNSIAYQCDLRNRISCLHIANDINERTKGIDVLINNAGYDSDSTFIKMKEESWNDVLNINLNSIYNYAQHFIPNMIENKWGRIINITSIAGFKGAFGKSNYSAAKAGVVGFTKSLALELASKGITVNAIAPGAIETDMLFRIPERYRDVILKDIPMNRFGKPKEVADLIAFLISDKASYITGQTIHINGGSYL